MNNFIHIADLHLGYSQYGIEERSNDFMKNFKLVMQEDCKLFLVSGDVFHKRQISPKTLSDTVNILRDAVSEGKEIIVIPGNHDKIFTDGMTWLTYLAHEKLINLIINSHIDNGNFRIFGFNTFMDLYKYTQEHTLQTDNSKINVLMIHEGVEGYCYESSMSKEDINLIKNMGIDYLALGHIHTPYIIDGWIYNPGSIERTSVNDKVGGFYFYKDGDVSFTEFDVRPTYRMEVNVTNMDEEKIIKEIKNFVRKIPKPDISILQIKFSGRMNNIFSAKSLIPEGFFHTIVINETTFNSIQISLEKSDSNQIEKEVVDQITAGRDDVKDLIYKLISVVEPSDLTVDDILLLIGEVE